MRETERVRIMERMREKVRERERRMMEGEYGSQRKKRAEDLIKKTAFVAQNPLHLTIFRLLDSIRVSIDPRSREFLIFAALGVNEAVELLKSLEEFRDRIESKRMKALEGEISEASLKLENVLDSHVSDQFLTQSEAESIQLARDERQPLVFSLNLQGIEQDIDGFAQMMMKMEKLLNPWLEEEDGDGGGKESEEENGDDDGGDQSEVDVSRSWFISWFATKAASVFLGLKEEYIQDLENLLPEEKEGDDYAVLFTTDRKTDFSRMVSESRFRTINGDLMVWWISKVCSILVMEEDYTQGLVNHLPEDAAAAVAVNVVSAGTETGVNMVGSTHLFCKIRDDLLMDCKRLSVDAIVGMVGIGKTDLAKKIIEDPLISSKFECCIFVRMGPESQWRETLKAILAQMPDGDKMLMEEDVDLDYSVRKTLMDRKCLIVLDDFWDRGPEGISHMFPWTVKSQSVVLLTTRANDLRSHIGSIYEVPFLNKEESWDLLCEKIFGERRCPPQLEKAGRKIAENCEGLPLLIITVADLLSQAEKTPEYWSKVATNKTNSIFVDAYKQVSDVVYPSYHYLPQHVKPCFLYMAAFPQNDEFRISRLISLWSADGFLGVPYTVLQKHAYDSLREIAFKNVAMRTQWSMFHLRHKALTLHSVFWYLCKREALNEKFLHVLNSYTDASVQDIKTQRRLSIYKNTILSIKDVRHSIASISALHSLLCTGPYHQYEVPICFGKLRLLKVLDVLTIRFYEFPKEVVKLVQLRYLAITCNCNLPPSISNLWGLQSLILHQHQSIKSSSVSNSYLPVNIWDLQELEHLQIMGRNLPDPPPGVILRNLLILLDVGAHTCNERVLASIPNLKKLRVQIVLMPVDAEPLKLCDDISRRISLRSLQCVVTNPELKFEIVALVAIFSFSNIRKLTLSGLGCHWKDMHSIAKLSHLEELKLKCYAFRGEKWQVQEGEFQSLIYLVIEDTDLVQWTAKYLSFQRLNYLTIKHCYRLLELPKLYSIRYIHVVDCNPSAVTCAKQMKYCDVSVDSSWLGDGKLS